MNVCIECVYINMFFFVFCFFLYVDPRKNSLPDDLALANGDYNKINENEFCIDTNRKEGKQTRALRVAGRGVWDFGQQLQVCPQERSQAGGPLLWVGVFVSSLVKDRRHVIAGLTRL